MSAAYDNTLTAPCNDLETVKALFAENTDAIAGVILDPSSATPASSTGTRLP